MEVVAWTKPTSASNTTSVSRPACGSQGPWVRRPANQGQITDRSKDQVNEQPDDEGPGRAVSSIKIKSKIEVQIRPIRATGMIIKRVPDNLRPCLLGPVAGVDEGLPRGSRICDRASPPDIATRGWVSSRGRPYTAGHSTADNKHTHTHTHTPQPRLAPAGGGGRVCSGDRLEELGQAPCARRRRLPIVLQQPGSWRARVMPGPGPTLLSPAQPSAVPGAPGAQGAAGLGAGGAAHIVDI